MSSVRDYPLRSKCKNHGSCNCLSTPDLPSGRRSRGSTSVTGGGGNNATIDSGKGDEEPSFSDLETTNALSTPYSYCKGFILNTSTVSSVFSSWFGSSTISEVKLTELNDSDYLSNDDDSLSEDDEDIIPPERKLRGILITSGSGSGERRSHKKSNRSVTFGLATSTPLNTLSSSNPTSNSHHHQYSNGGLPGHTGDDENFHLSRKMHRRGGSQGGRKRGTGGVPSSDITTPVVGTGDVISTTSSTTTTRRAASRRRVLMVSANDNATVYRVPPPLEDNLLSSDEEGGMDTTFTIRRHQNGGNNNGDSSTGDVDVKMMMDHGVVTRTIYKSWESCKTWCGSVVDVVLRVPLTFWQLFMRFVGFPLYWLLVQCLVSEKWVLEQRGRGLNNVNTVGKEETRINNKYSSFFRGWLRSSSSSSSSVEDETTSQTEGYYSDDDEEENIVKNGKVNCKLEGGSTLLGSSKHYHVNGNGYVQKPSTSTTTGHVGADDESRTRLFSFCRTGRSADTGNMTTLSAAVSDRLGEVRGWGRRLFIFLKPKTNAVATHRGEGMSFANAGSSGEYSAASTVAGGDSSRGDRTYLRSPGGIRSRAAGSGFYDQHGDWNNTSLLTDDSDGEEELESNQQQWDFMRILRSILKILLVLLVLAAFVWLAIWFWPYFVGYAAESFDFITLCTTTGYNSLSSVISYCWTEMIGGLNLITSLIWYGLVQLGALISTISSVPSYLLQQSEPAYKDPTTAPIDFAATPYPDTDEPTQLKDNVKLISDDQYQSMLKRISALEVTLKGYENRFYDQSRRDDKLESTIGQLEVSIRNTRTDLEELKEKSIDLMITNKIMTFPLGHTRDGLIVTLDTVVSLIDEMKHSGKEHRFKLEEVVGILERYSSDNEMMQTRLDNMDAGLGSLKTKLSSHGQTKVEVVPAPIVDADILKSILPDIRKEMEPLLTVNCVKHCPDAENSVALSSDDVKKLIHRAIMKYDADKTGLPDLALEPAGGSIISTRCTKSSKVRNSVVSIWGFKIWSPPNNPRVIIQPGLVPGECWAFEGSVGDVVIKLIAPSVVTAFTMEHIPKTVSPYGNIASAPQKFQVLGMHSENDLDSAHNFGTFSYEDNGEPIQYYTVQNETSTAYPIVELKVLSNHGNLLYTCLYRFRVHGQAFGIDGPSFSATVEAEV